MPVPTGSVHAHILKSLRRAEVGLSRKESVEPGAATWFVTGRVGPCSKWLENTRYEYNMFWEPTSDTKPSSYRIEKKTLVLHQVNM